MAENTRRTRRSLLCWWYQTSIWLDHAIIILRSLHSAPVIPIYFLPVGVVEDHEIPNPIHGVDILLDSEHRTRCHARVDITVRHHLFDFLVQSLRPAEPSRQLAKSGRKGSRCDGIRRKQSLGVQSSIHLLNFDSSLPFLVEHIVEAVDRVDAIRCGRISLGRDALGCPGLRRGVERHQGVSDGPRAQRWEVLGGYSGDRNA